jgi:hypothetical protein
MPLLDTLGETGKFIGSITAQPEKLKGKWFCAAEGLYSLDEECAIISKRTRKKVLYEQIAIGELREIMGLPTVVSDVFGAFSALGRGLGISGPARRR